MSRLPSPLRGGAGGGVLQTRNLRLGLGGERVIDKAGIPFRLTLPHKGFHRAIGNFAGHFISPEGEVLTEEAWKNHQHEWLPAAGDHAYVQSLMSGRVVEPGKFANWIAPPGRGINNQPLSFEYVRFN